MQFDEDFRRIWLAQHELALQKYGTLHRTAEQPAATALVMNLTHVNVRNALDSFAAAEGNDATEHAGVRTTFVILRMLSAGFSAFQADTTDAGKRKQAGGRHVTNAPKERYGQMQADGSVVLYGYELSNKKGVYSKGERAEQFVAIGPGMVISTRVFGNKMQSVFGKDAQPPDTIEPFQLALVQIGTVSLSSKSTKNGNLLQVRTFNPLPQYSPSSARLVPYGVMQSSVQASTARREAFLSGCLVPEENKDNANMSMISTSLTTSFHALDVGFIEAKNGAFAVSATGTIRFHITEPITDISVTCLDIKYDKRDFGTTDVQWLTKLFSVAVMLKSLRLIIAIDEYRNKSLDPQDQVADAWAFIDVAKLIQAVYAASNIAPLEQSTAPNADAIRAVFHQQAGNPAKFITLFAGCTDDIDVAVDRRCMRKDADNLITPFSAIAYTDSNWSRGRLAHVFYQSRPVLALVVPATTHGGADGGSSALDTIAIPTFADNVQFEDDAYDSGAAAASQTNSAAAKRAKK